MRWSNTNEIGYPKLSSSHLDLRKEQYQNTGKLDVTLKLLTNSKAITRFHDKFSHIDKIRYSNGHQQISVWSFSVSSKV